MDAVRRRLLIVVSPLVCRCQATCKRTHQLQTLLAQQCWELLRPCWQCCASGCNNSQHCWEGYNSFVNQVLYVCVAPTMLKDLRRSCANGSTIVTFRFRDHGTNERNVGICWLKSLTGSNLCATKRNNTQKHATTRNNMQQGVQTDASCKIQQCCVRFHEALGFKPECSYSISWMGESKSFC